MACAFSFLTTNRHEFCLRAAARNDRTQIFVALAPITYCFSQLHAMIEHKSSLRLHQSHIVFRAAARNDRTQIFIAPAPITYHIRPAHAKLSFIFNSRVQLFLRPVQSIVPQECLRTIANHR
jgi:hypothetical protein